jgi:hypothetical protein
VTLTDPRAGDRCPRCRHLIVQHRANATTPNVPLESPVPCFAVIGRNDRRYEYCHCTYLVEQETP